MTAEQIALRINTAKSIREAEGLDDYLQRELGKNVKKICKYLIGNDWRMFNSIVVGVFDGIPDWITFNLDNIDRISDIPPESINYLSDSIGMLVLNGDEKMFAIDGQHRVEAIKLALKEKNHPLLDDQYPVLLVAHNDSKDGKKRTRRLFFDINKKAVKVSSGDLAVIGEEDLDAVVARRLYAECRYFENGNLIALTSNANMDKGDMVNFTNLLTLCSVAKLIKPDTIKNQGWQDADIDTVYSESVEFIDFIVNNIDEFKDYFTTKEHVLKYFRTDNPNILFRPIGLILLAKIYCYFKKSNELEYLKGNINKLDFSLPGNHYNLIVWNRGRIETKYQDVAYLLTLYLLNRLPQNMVNGESGLVAKFGLATKGAITLPEKVV
jgi:DNA sulfur modification protein DndB